ncbi:hypothetical protein LCGC14_1480760 [marine sediment metagenome]|uniref:DNA-directed RNA polymerase RBP11-like dimerisation domain-containing protein n=1 Tax=marine sediment metagenome TaxID=412755 RepID=A0A0F9JVK0_9ZZZZ
MAKKKANKPEKEGEDELDDLSDEEEIEAVYPKVDEKKKKEEDKSIVSLPEDVSNGEIDGDDLDVDEEEEEEPRFPDYKYLDLTLNKTLGENDYELMVEGQSHGFCNILVKSLLEIEGVNMAAYKITNIKPPQIYIRLENSKDYKIKDILYKGIESLREEVIKVQKLFQKLI